MTVIFRCVVYIKLYVCGGIVLTSLYGTENLTKLNENVTYPFWGDWERLVYNYSDGKFQMRGIALTNLYGIENLKKLNENVTNVLGGTEKELYI